MKPIVLDNFKKEEKNKESHNNYLKKKLKKEYLLCQRVSLMNVLIMLEKGYSKIIKLFFRL